MVFRNIQHLIQQALIFKSYEHIIQYDNLKIIMIHIKKPINKHKHLSWIIVNTI
jgi:hypothetical protein